MKTLNNLYSTSFKCLFIILLICFTGIKSTNASNQLPFLQSVDPQLEVIEKRDRTSKTFEIAPGSFTSVFSAGQSLHYKEDGNWKEISTQIKEVNDPKFDGFRFANETNTFKTYFSELVEGGIITRINEGEFKENFTNIYYVKNNEYIKIQSLSNASADISANNSLVYQNAYTSTDILLSLGNDSRKLDYILNNPELFESVASDASHIAFAEVMEIPSNWEVKYSNEEINIYDKNGKWLMQIPRPVIYEDGATIHPEESDKQSIFGNYRIELKNNKLTIYTLVDYAWLSDPERSYPVIVDPSINFYPDNASFWTGYQASSTGKVSGYLRLLSSTTSSWAKFNISNMPSGTSVLSVEYWGYAYSGTQTADKFVSVRNMGNTDPVPSTAATIWSAIDNATPYITNYQWNVPPSGNDWTGTGNLGSTANTDLEGYVSRGWVAYGFRWQSGGTGFQYHAAYNSSTPPYLLVSYCSGVCSDPPTAGSAVSSVSDACPNRPFTLSLDGASGGCGQEYTWQVSPDNSNWSNFAGPGPDFNEVEVSQTASTRYYRAQLVCNAGSPSYSSSVRVDIGTAIQDTFYIDQTGNGDFLTFNDAVNTLCLGLAGPVVFMVEPGTYNETLNIEGPFNGSSATNTITFNGVDPNNVTLTSTDGATVTISGAEWITFENMTVNNTTSNPSIGFHLNNQANHITIRNNVINATPGSQSAANIGIAATSALNATSAGNNANNLTIENNDITSGYYGISIYGTNTATFGENYKIINNNIVARYYGIRLYYIYNIEISDNIIDVESQGGTGWYPTFIYYTNELKMERNFIFSKYYGIRLYYVNYTGPNASTSKARVTNNMVSAYNYTNLYPMYIYYTNNLEFYHNSIHGNNTGTCCRLIQIYYGADIKIKNNIFSSTGTLAYFIYAYDAGITEMDYNVFNDNNSTTAFAYWYDGTANTYSAFSDWQNGTAGFDQNSIEDDPDFTSNTDLRIPISKDFYIGDNLGIDIDIFGTPRCYNVMGAYELPLPSPPPVAGFNAPDTAYVNSPFTVLSSTRTDPPQFDHWYSNGQYVDSYLRSIDFTFSNTGVNEIMMISLDCSGDIKDTLIKNVVIINPPSPPLANFISDLNFIEGGNEVKFFDMSTIGPVSWQWEVNPPTVDIFGIPFSTHSFEDGTNASSQNPVISFPWPGTYTVSLTAYNSMGDDTETKDYYIVVGHTMCHELAPDFTSSTDPSGLLFDDEGKYPYGSNQECSFLIEPCVDKLYLTFETFELECGSDFVRIYDGTDNTGEPLFTGNGFTGGGDNCGSLQLPPDTLVALSGRAFIEWESGQNSEEYQGFELRWFSDEKISAPEASFEVADTICAGWPVHFENTSTGGGIENAFWNFDITGSGSYSYTGYNGNHQYAGPGTYTVGLIVEDCAGLRDTFLQQVNVEFKTVPPSVDFSADNLTPQANVDLVNFTSEVSGGCNDTYEWIFSPAHAIQYLNGTDSGSKHPEVMFVASGCVDVELRISNPTGTVIENKICYIQVFEYCQPSVTHTSQDVGISRVVLEDIVNSSTAGDNDGYTSYIDSSGISASLEAGQTYTIRIERNTNLNNIDRGAWIDFNQDRNFSNNELIAFESNSNAKTLVANFNVPGDAKPGTTRLRVAVNYGGHGLHSCGPHQFGEFEDYLIYITPDVTTPLITLFGGDTVYVEVNDSYTEAGYTAWDDADGDLTSEVSFISNVDTSVIGTYEINYEVTDASGNTGTITRIVIVQDTQNPEITLIGDDPLYVEVNTVFVDPGVTITDNYWNDIIADITTNLDMTEMGQYEMEYCATDGSGNGPVCVKRTIIVEDNTPPAIIFTEGDTIIVEVYSDFEIPEVIIEDNYWAFEDLVIDASDAEQFSTDEIGYFSLTYEATDGSGNTAIAILVIHVVDTEAPVIELINGDIINIMQWSEFIDPGFVVTDNYDENPEVITGGTFENTHTPGLYYRTYHAIDQSGNESEIYIRYISVIEAPVSIENELENQLNVIVFPNPSSDGSFNVKIEMDLVYEGRIMITDLLGRDIKTIAEGILESNIFEVDMSDNASGVYLIRIETSEFNMIERINIAR